MNKLNRKMFYLFIGCVSLALLIVGATYAYFAASVTDANTVKGNSATVTFGLSVDRVTTIDMAYGLIPMKNIEAPSAAKKMCHDDLGNAGCQIYKITINADSDTVMFLDGYIAITPNTSILDEGETLETRFTRLYSDDGGSSFYTSFTTESFGSLDFDEDEYIKNGVRVSSIETPFNRTEDYGCILVRDERIGGTVGRQLVFYAMVWVYDNNQPQDYLQGLQLAYSGEVTFVTAEGNEISASFD